MKKITQTLIACGIVLGVGGNAIAVAQSPHPHTAAREQFRYIEQPLPLKVGLTLGGLGLIGLELWWFLGNSSQSQTADNENPSTD
ncbi:MAG: hypothetical protein LRZ84_03115 [Desertifilum sp.]|nr:hypothetical protein [Desertifilum sp.]MDI9637869.1 hypothetical protein [Geitlerinema splendidum]